MAFFTAASKADFQHQLQAALAQQAEGARNEVRHPCAALTALAGQHRQELAARAGRGQGARDGHAPVPRVQTGVSHNPASRSHYEHLSRESEATKMATQNVIAESASSVHSVAGDLAG